MDNIIPNSVIDFLTTFIFSSFFFFLMVFGEPIKDLISNYLKKVLVILKGFFE